MFIFIWPGILISQVGSAPAYCGLRFESGWRYETYGQLASIASGSIITLNNKTVAVCGPSKHSHDHRTIIIMFAAFDWKTSRCRWMFFRTICWWKIHGQCEGETEMQNEKALCSRIWIGGRPSAHIAFLCGPRKIISNDWNAFNCFQTNWNHSKWTVMQSFKFKMCIFFYISWKLVNLVSLAYQQDPHSAHKEDTRPIYVQILGFYIRIWNLVAFNIELKRMFSNSMNHLKLQPPRCFHPASLNSININSLSSPAHTPTPPSPLPLPKLVAPKARPSQSHNDETHLDDQKSMENPSQVRNEINSI